jgi:hypothetical protein
MSTLAVNTITNAAGGNTAQINGMTPTAQSLQGFRNRIINGDMRIDQRNAGASVTPTNGQYTLDRWSAGLTQASKFSVQRSTTAATGFTNSLLATSLSAHAVVTSDAFFVNQSIEGFNVADLGWGTASAQTVNLSFWVRSSLTGTFGGALANSAADRSYPFNYTVNAANTWEQKTVTIVGDSTGTWLTDSSIGIRVRFSLGAGATTSSAFPNAWNTGNFVQPTGSVSVVGTSGATFYITGVQLEAGSTATPFERRDYGRELIMCQRYFQVIGDLTRLVGMAFSSTANPVSWPLVVTMRAAPSTVALSGTGSSTVLIGGSNLTLTGIQNPVSSPSVVSFDALVASGGTSGFGCQLRLSGSSISASAEL